LLAVRAGNARIVGRGTGGVFDEHGRNPPVELVELSKQVVLSSFKLLQENKRGSGGVHQRGGSWVSCVFAKIAIGAPNQTASTELGAAKKTTTSPCLPAEAGEGVPVT